MQQKRTLVYTTALTAMLVASQAFANPEGGIVVGGSADISSADKTLTVNQHSDKAIIDWRSFDIQVDEHTQFVQPNSSSAILNRVNDVNPSNIMGKLTANGNVLIVNPNGVMFGADSKVDVNGLIATTADINNADFMKGNLQFNKAGKVGAKIINYGTITAKDAGLVGLVAPQVENHGVITAKSGRVHLASGDTMAVDLYGDGLMEVAVNDHVKDQLVSNNGLIEVGNGTIALTAAAGREMVNSLITVDGELSASTVSQKGGKIIIGAAGSNGTTKTGKSTVKVLGNIKATGNGANSKGGEVIVAADQVALVGDSTIDASGVDGGGWVKVGGDYQGKGETQRAANTYIGASTSINVSGGLTGDAGTAIVWADDRAQFHGKINAQGGLIRGDGGFVETSGKNSLSVTGTVTAAAVVGDSGTWLLDPRNIVIQDDAGGAPDDTDTIDTDGPIFESDDDDDTVTTEAIETALATSNVTIQTGSGGGQDGDITVNNQIDWASNNDLTFIADDDMNVSATIINTGSGDVTFTADAIAITAAVTGNGGTLTIQNDNAATTIGLGTGAGALSVSDAELGNLSGWASYIFGGSNGTDGTSGDMTVVTGHDFADANVTLRSGGAINLDGTLNKATGTGTVNYVFESDDEFAQSASANITTTAGMTNLTINADKDANSDGFISFFDSVITTGGGNVVMGGGANPSTTAATGVDTHGVSVQRTNIDSGVGNVSIRGHSTGTADQDHGVYVAGRVGADNITTTTGTITITGTSDITANGAYGIMLNDEVGGAAAILRTTGGNIAISGTGSANATGIGHGIRMKDDVDILSTSGNITITAIAGGGGSARAINVNGGAANIIGGPSHAGTINMIVSEYTTDANLPLQTTGTVIIEEAVDGTTIGIGNGGTIAISNAELGTMTAGSFIFGGTNGTDGTSGDMTIDTTHDFADANVTFRSGGDIDFDSTLDKATGAGTVNYVFESDDEFDQNNGADITTSSGVMNLTINADKDNNEDGQIGFDTSTITTGGGNVIFGGGADPSTDFAVNTGGSGVSLDDTSITTGVGNITIRGKATDGSGGGAVRMVNDTDLLTTSGSISIYGENTGGLGVNLFGHGINIDGNTNSLSIVTGSGDILLDGTGDPTATSNSRGGLRFRDTFSIDSTTGNITLIGESAGNAGTAIHFSNPGTIGSGTMTGAITIMGDDMILPDTIQTTGTVTLEEKTNGTSIGLGGGAGTLSLSDTELDLVTAATIVVGGTDTGVVTIDGLTLDDSLTVNGSSIAIAGNADVGANTLTLDAATGGISTTAGTLTATSLNLDAATTMVADVNATNVDINSNATGVTLTGLVNGGADQAAANAIVGGPGNSGSYTFEGFTIRNSPPSTPVTPPSTTDTPTDTTTDIPTDTPTDTTTDIPTDTPTDTTTDTTTTISADDRVLPATVEIVSQVSGLIEVGASEQEVEAFLIDRGVKRLKNGRFTLLQDYDDFAPGAQDDAQALEILYGLIKIHPMLVELFALEDELI